MREFENIYLLQPCERLLLDAGKPESDRDWVTGMDQPRLHWGVNLNWAKNSGKLAKKVDNAKKAKKEQDESKRVKMQNGSQA